MINNNPKEELEYFATDCANRLIQDNPKEERDELSYRFLEKDDLNHLVGLILETEEEIDKLDFLDDTQAMYVITDAFAKYLKTKDPKHSQDVMNVMKYLALQHYEKRIDTLIEDSLKWKSFDAKYNSYNEDYHEAV